MIWSIEFLEEAEKDMKKLDHSAQIQVLKGITKVSKNPLPAEEGGYGKPLGNKSGINLTNLLKIKFRDLGIRVVYKVERVDGVMKIIVYRGEGNRFLSLQGHELILFVWMDRFRYI